MQPRWSEAQAMRAENIVTNELAILGASDPAKPGNYFHHKPSIDNDVIPNRLGAYGAKFYVWGHYGKRFEFQNPSGSYQYPEMRWLIEERMR
jgi:hypothetical protein